MRFCDPPLQGKELTTHDVRPVIESLRNHLAGHDRRALFLFGAGTSSSINIAPPPLAGKKRGYDPLIPGIDGLTRECEAVITAMGNPFADAWLILVDQCRNGRTPNVENILSKLRMKIDAIGDGETLLGLTLIQLKAMEEVICSTVGKRTCVDEKRIPPHTPHDDFCAWIRKINRSAPIEIFTTNYDVLFERALESARVPLFDGFVGAHRPFLYPECLDDDSLLPHVRWVRLWKLHGSVTWHRADDGIGKHVFRAESTGTGEMILPSHWKYDQSRKQPFVAYMERLSRVLNSEHSVLITCGYSFGDEHINAILFGALENCHTANIIALGHQDLGVTDSLVKYAHRYPNLSVIGPNAGVISGVWGEWQLSEPVDSKTCGFLDTAFDSNGLPEDTGSPASPSDDLRGRLRLGDFNFFCQFLKEMGPANQ